MRKSRRASFLALLLVAACDTPRPSPTEPPRPTDSAAASPSPTVALTPAPTEPLPVPVAADLIADAVIAGRLDPAMGYLYRYYAQWGDPRLPKEFWGARGEDHALQLAGVDNFAELDPEDQALLRPFSVRPTHPESYWTSSESRATANRFAVLARSNTDDPRCLGGMWGRLDVAGIPVTIWGRCELLPDGSTTLNLAGAMGDVDGIIKRLWVPMTNLMGKPIPDAFAGTFQGLYEVDEAGDGRTDIYLVDSPNVTYDRDLDVSYSGAAAGATAPFSNPAGTHAPYAASTAAGYMIIEPRRVAAQLQSVIAHEFFHVLQGNFNRYGTVVCPYPNQTTTCPQADRTYHWFVEATAVWAEHEFLPMDRAEPHAEFDQFLQSDLALADTDRENEYESFMWPLFMEQESAIGPGVIADAWDAIRGQTGWAAVQAAVDSQQPFESSFRDFAVRVWNEELDGDPINPRFRHSALDPTFPETRPSQTRPAPRWQRDVDPVLDVANTSTIVIPELWAGYYRVNIPADAHRLTLNFAGLVPNDKLDADALVKIRDGKWERRELDPLVTEWCLDKPADAVEEMVLVLSNHSQIPEDQINGDWTVTAERAGCLTIGESLVYTAVSTTGTPGEELYGSRAEKLTVQLVLKSNDGTTSFLADYLNDDSSYSATVQTEFFQEIFDHQCDIVAEGVGGAGGPVPGLDGVVASLTHVSGPVADATVPPGGGWILTVAGAFPVKVVTETTNCLGSSTEETLEYIQLPTCPGTEILDSDPARTFDFHCVFTGDGSDWSLIGKVRLSG